MLTTYTLWRRVPDGGICDRALCTSYLVSEVNKMFWEYFHPINMLSFMRKHEIFDITILFFISL